MPLPEPQIPFPDEESGLSFAQAAGILRVSMDDELAGLDESHHGGSAYDFSAEGKATGPIA